MPIAGRGWMGADRPADLLLIAHGSRDRALQADALETHAHALRQKGAFGRVATGYLLGGPGPAEALQSLDAPCVFIVPHFMSAGYFAQTAVPAALGLEGWPPPGLTADPGLGGQVVQRPGRDGRPQRLCYCPPTGSHPDLHQVGRRLSLAACAAAGLAPGRTGLLVIGHGTARDPASAAATHRQAERLAEPGDFALVRAAFLEQAPRPTAALADMAAEEIIVLGLFAGLGRHGGEDLPALAGPAAARGQRLHFAGIIGQDAAMAELILDLIRRTQAALP